MRRKEFQIGEEQYEDIEQFLNEMSFGFLGTWRKDAYPGITPINYIYYNEAIYLHGSKAGEKMKSITKNPNVSFAVAKEYAQIPSYMSDPFYACPATVFFKSVYITGMAVIVQDVEEKCEVLNELMRKLQPEGGYEPIRSSHSGYASRVQATAIIRIDIDTLNAKFKFGQNWNEQKLDNISDKLLQRNQPLDKETSALMKRYCPHVHSDNNQ